MHGEENIFSSDQFFVFLKAHLNSFNIHSTFCCTNNIVENI